MNDFIDKATATKLASDYLAILTSYLRDWHLHRFDFYPMSQLVIITGISRRFPDAIGWEGLRVEIPFDFVSGEWVVDENRVDIEFLGVGCSVTSGDSRSQCDRLEIDPQADGAGKEQRGITTAQS